MKKIRIGLFGRIVIAILAGVALGYLFMHTGAAGAVGVRVLKTFNVLFAQVLKFIVPLLIRGLVTPAIANAGKGAGKMLVFVMVFSYLSTCCASLFAYFSAGQLLPLYVAKGAVAAAGVMCGVLMASVGFLESVIGLTPEQTAVLMAFYMALDGYGPAANVTGDGAIALVADRFFGGRGKGAAE